MESKQLIERKLSSAINSVALIYPDWGVHVKRFSLFRLYTPMSGLISSATRNNTFLGVGCTDLIIRNNAPKMINILRFILTINCHVFMVKWIVLKSKTMILNNHNFQIQLVNIHFTSSLLMEYVVTYYSLFYLDHNIKRNEWFHAQFLLIQ